MPRVNWNLCFLFPFFLFWCPSECGHDHRPGAQACSRMCSEVTLGWSNRGWHVGMREIQPKMKTGPVRAQDGQRPKMGPRAGRPGKAGLASRGVKNGRKTEGAGRGSPRVGPQGHRGTREARFASRSYVGVKRSRFRNASCPAAFSPGHARSFFCLKMTPKCFQLKIAACYCNYESLPAGSGRNGAQACRCRMRENSRPEVTPFMLTVWVLSLTSLVQRLNTAAIKENADPTPSPTRSC